MTGHEQRNRLSRPRCEITDTPAIVLFDTSATTFNAGDFIIMDAVWSELRGIFPIATFATVPTHDHLGPQAYKTIDESDYAFVGGTNLLASHMDVYKQWKVAGAEMLRLRNLILMGVGWWQYQDIPNIYTATLLRTILHPDLLHSVRDEYTARMLRSIGFENVVNTGCVTTWSLSEIHCASIPRQKGNVVLLTFTDYKPDRHADEQLYRTVRRHYDRVYFWLQGRRDWEYAREILDPDVEIVGGTLAALDRILNEVPNLDYVGTRLHAGIRAMQHGRRTLVIAVDNRAAEMGRDMNLPVVARGDMPAIERAVCEERATTAALPSGDIARWKAQFRNSDRS